MLKFLCKMFDNILYFVYDEKRIINIRGVHDEKRLS